MPQKSPKGTIRPPLLGAQDVCLHENAVPVELLRTRECVAKLCPDCDAQLPAGWMSAAQERLLMLANHGGLAAHPTSQAALSLIAAGFQVRDVAEVVMVPEMRNGHLPEACPRRIDVTGIADSSPIYIHGACEPDATPAS